MSYENFKPNELLIESYSAKPSCFVHRIPNGIRATHLPTGTVVICDTDRSQHKNRHDALTQLWELVCGNPTYQELAAQVEALRAALSSQLNDCINFDGGKLTDVIMEHSSKVLMSTPQNHLRQVRADAGRDGFIAGGLAWGALGHADIAESLADDYFDRIMQGE